MNTDELATKWSAICVDDESPALRNFQSTLADCPQLDPVEYFLRSKEALRYAQDNPVDVAFLDVDMPEMDGFTLAEQLKGIYPNIRVVFVTGNVDYMNPSKQKVKAPFLFKPYDREELLNTLPRI